MIVRITRSAARVKPSWERRARSAERGIVGFCPPPSAVRPLAWLDGRWRMADGRDLPGPRAGGGAICPPPSAICLEVSVRNMIERLAGGFALHVGDAGLLACVRVGLGGDRLGASRFAVLQRGVHDPRSGEHT